MNKDVDLYEILKHCQRHTKLYSPLFGDVYLDTCMDDTIYVDTRTDFGLKCFTAHGRFYPGVGECLLFPSRECRDWSKWVFSAKFDPKTLQPFDKVLVKLGEGNYYTWVGDFVSEPNIGSYRPYTMINNGDGIIIPYNDDTKHLIGTSEEAPKYYRYWED